MSTVHCKKSVRRNKSGIYCFDQKKNDKKKQEGRVVAVAIIPRPAG